jgi:hypothetical protein
MAGGRDDGEEGQDKGRQGAAGVIVVRMDVWERALLGAILAVLLLIALLLAVALSLLCRRRPTLADPHHPTLTNQGRCSATLLRVEEGQKACPVTCVCA